LDEETLEWNYAPTPGEPPDHDNIIIMSHILPARTKALGSYNLDLGLGSIDMGLTASNQDHSAIFHARYYDRKDLCGDVLLRFDLKD
jgi:hypothetical protein